MGHVGEVLGAEPTEALPTLAFSHISTEREQGLRKHTSSQDSLGRRGSPRDAGHSKAPFSPGAAGRTERDGDLGRVGPRAGAPLLSHAGSPQAQLPGLSSRTGGTVPLRQGDKPCSLSRLPPHHHEPDLKHAQGPCERACFHWLLRGSICFFCPRDPSF